MNEILNFRTSYFFPPITRYLGYVISIIGIIGVFNIGIQSLLICIVGLGLSFTRYGVLIDTKQKKLREYISVYWIKFGKWGILESYPYLTVLEITETTTMYSRSNVKHSDKNLVFKVTLLNENHHMKIPLRQLKSRDLAHRKAEDIANKIGVKKVIYSPK